ncbi:hypothetical protein [Nocardioides euryhalodurans]|uniref:Uncharacterized protein n=1 Tax=Nocardioides euryhalodurans TaxID=2518370 RepID=A0A4P7GL09_9ACTN|nr:hypothetical protein [Nocardioides euryhalodurans]QBR92710.1 hypothetical protein EXE57_10810 [Nocardioides euryhalodurans]
MSQWLESLSTLQVLLLVLAVTFGLSVLAVIVGAVLVRLGMRRPAVVEWASQLAERVFTLVKRPLTIVVLDEVAAVLRTGHYTENISRAITENHDQLKALIAEKVRQDPNVRLIGKLPGYDAIVGEVTETTLRVVVEMLADPRTDELVSDLLRNNLEQIKQAVRSEAHVDVEPHDPPDPVTRPRR